MLISCKVAVKVFGFGERLEDMVCLVVFKICLYMCHRLKTFFEISYFSE